MELEYSQKILEKISQFIKEECTIQKDEIDYVSIHGHTIFHNPAKKITVQITNLAYLAAGL